MLSKWQQSILRREELANKPKKEYPYGCVVCCEPKKSKGMCNKHYQRYYRAELNRRKRKGLEK